MRPWILAAFILGTACASAHAQDQGGVIDTRGDVGEQIQRLERQVRGDAPPWKQAVAYRWLAELYISVGRLDDAQRAYERILVFDPYDIATSNLLAAFLLDRREDAASAEKILRTTIGWAAAAERPSAYLGLTYAEHARALHALGRHEEAIQAADDAIALVDADAAEQAVRIQVRCFEALGERDRAQATLLRLIGMTGDAEPDDENHLIALAAGKGGSVAETDVDARIRKAIDDARREREEALRLEGAEMIVLTGGDHVRLEATLRRGKEAGAVLFIPDLGGRRAVFTPYAQLLALDGLTTLTVDPRGHGDSRCDSLPSFHGMSAHHREQLAADVASGYRYLHETLHVPVDRIAVVAEGGACAVVEYAIHDERITPVVVHLSPAFDPGDLELAAALEFRRPRPTLLVASDEDIFAMNSLDRLTGEGTRRQVVRASGHGVAVLRDPETFATVSAWTRKALGVSP